MSHLRELMESQFPYPVTLLYYAKNRDEFIFQAELEAIAKHFPQVRVYLINTRETASDNHLSGHLREEHLQRALNFTPEHVFICGPNALREAAEALIAENYDHRPACHSESFGLVVKPGAGTENAQPVRLTKSHKTIECGPDTPLLEAAEQNGLSPNYGCRMGICHTCKCKKSSGIVRNAVTGKVSGNDEEEIQLCISIPETPVELDL